MHVHNKTLASGSAILLLVVPAAGLARISGTPFPVPQNAEPPSYTFRLNVVMAMRHFPWLHFRIQGIGIYNPGVSYAVHFTDVPWFIPNAHHDADLSMLDPLMWPGRFKYEEIGRQNGDTIFSLRALNDPTLRDATVTLGPDGCARRADTTYTDGSHVDTQLSSSNVDGFLLPVTMTATIDEPHMALSANADFKDYNFSFQPNSGATSQ